MSDTLQEMARYLLAAAAELQEACSSEDYERAKHSAKECLSAGSKLYQRLAVLVDVAREARWVAAVDRQVPPAAPQIPGQRTFADELKAIRDKPGKVAKPRASRKPKG